MKSGGSNMLCFAGNKVFFEGSINKFVSFRMLLHVPGLRVHVFAAKFKVHERSG